MVKYKLKSPSTAIWKDYTENYFMINDKGYIVVMGGCEAMNGFGGYGRVSYLFEIHESGKIMYEFVY